MSRAAAIRTGNFALVARLKREIYRVNRFRFLAIGIGDDLENNGGAKTKTKNERKKERKRYFFLPAVIVTSVGLLRVLLLLYLH